MHRIIVKTTIISKSITEEKQLTKNKSILSSRFDIPCKNRKSKHTKIKIETKTKYKSILQKDSQEHIIFTETLWKNKINHLDFTKTWKNTYYSYS